MPHIELVPTVSLTCLTGKPCPGDWTLCPICEKTIRFDGVYWFRTGEAVPHVHRLHPSAFTWPDEAHDADDADEMAPPPPQVPPAPPPSKPVSDGAIGTGIEVSIWPSLPPRS